MSRTHNRWEVNTVTTQIDMKSFDKLIKYLPMLADYDRGRLIGIGEGVAMRMEAQRPKDEAKKEEK